MRRFLATIGICTTFFCLFATNSNSEIQAETMLEDGAYGQCVGIVEDVPTANLAVVNDTAGNYWVIETLDEYNVGDKITFLVDKDGLPLNSTDDYYDFSLLFE